MKNKNLTNEDEIDLELSNKDFSKVKRDVQSIPFSPYAKFMGLLNGYDLFMNRAKLDKWEAFYVCNDAGLIQAGLTRIQCVKR
jgi:hypothetical protein